MMLLPNYHSLIPGTLYKLFKSQMSSLLALMILCLNCLVDYSDHYKCSYIHQDMLCVPLPVLYMLVITHYIIICIVLFVVSVISVVTSCAWFTSLFTYLYLCSIIYNSYIALIQCSFCIVFFFISYIDMGNSDVDMLLRNCQYLYLYQHQSRTFGGTVVAVVRLLIFLIFAINNQIIICSILIMLYCTFIPNTFYSSTTISITLNRCLFFGI